METRTLTIIVLTYRRLPELASALPELLQQLNAVHDGEVLVVDNDVTPSAKSTVESSPDPRLRYVHEPTPGISAARNRGLAETSHREIVVFIDDDERPLAGWLENLLGTQESTGAEAVSGPVYSEYEGVLDPWIVAGRFFQHPRYPTGTVVDVAATNNLLLVRRFLSDHGLWFDEDFGLSGGEDSVFTRQLSRAGGKIVWCDEAAVRDVVPASRATRHWVRQRAIQIGNSEALARIHVAPSAGKQLRERVTVAGRGLLRVSGGTVKIVAGRLSGRIALHARGERALLRGWGMLQGVLGHRRLPYART